MVIRGWLPGLLTAIYVCNAASIATVGELTIFRRDVFPHHSAVSIGDPWISTNLLSCIRTCRSTYTTCFSVNYNINTGICSPGSSVTYNLFSPIRPDAELFYYTNFCNRQLGFEFFFNESFVQCLFVSTELSSFSSARKTCSDKDSRLIVVNSSNKLELLRYVIQHITRSRTWIGLTDLDTEGVYVWEDGQLASNASLPIPWRNAQPDNSEGNEDCVEIGSHGDSVTFNDQNCNDEGLFICEMKSP